MISIKTARWLDRKLGKPLCLMIGIARKLFPARKFPAKNSIRQIVIIKMWGMGSVILSSMAIRNLKNNCPDAEISLITLIQNKGLYDRHSVITRVIFFDMHSVVSAFISFSRIVRWLWKSKPQLIFDFEFASRFTAILSLLSFNSFSVGFAPRDSGKPIFDVTVAYDESEHVSQLFLRSLRAIGWDVSSYECLPVQIQLDDRLLVEKMLIENEVSEFIVINPNSSAMAPERMWPLELFGELCRQIFIQFHDFKMIIIGSLDDVVRGKNLNKDIHHDSHVLDWTGKFSISQTAFLLSRANVLISNDSGPMHLGALMGTPTIGLFGPETPALYGPLGEHTVALTSNEYCSPCISIYNDKVVTCMRQCACMKNISVSSVMSKIEKILIKRMSLESLSANF